LRPAVAAIAVLLLALTPVHKLSAQDLSVDSVSKEKLSRAVEHASKSDDYAWLRAQQISKDGENSFLARLNHDINNIFQTVGSWLSGIRDWLRRLFEKAQPDSPNPPAERPASGGDVRWLLYALAALVLVAALIVSSAAIQTPDLHQENVLASDLPEEEWLRLAREFLAQGEFRLAVRAMYLSNLSYLGSQQFIQIARSKSNSIYERELRLRPRGTQVFAPFAQANRSFERAWYGFHEVTPEFVEVFQQDVEAIRQHVKA
jgi:hypothetical protein